jgi:hypothetical protein
MKKTTSVCQPTDALALWAAIQTTTANVVDSGPWTPIERSISARGTIEPMAKNITRKLRVNNKPNTETKMTSKTTVWTRSMIIDTFESGYTFARDGQRCHRSARVCIERAILAIYARQTADERADGTTRHVNGRGFNSRDAKYGSYLARWIQSGRSLSGRHLTRAKRMAIRYSGQLIPA